MVCSSLGGGLLRKWKWQKAVFEYSVLQSFTNNSEDKCFGKLKGSSFYYIREPSYFGTDGCLYDDWSCKRVTLTWKPPPARTANLRDWPHGTQ